MPHKTFQVTFGHSIKYENVCIEESSALNYFKSNEENETRYDKGICFFSLFFNKRCICLLSFSSFFSKPILTESKPALIKKKKKVKNLPLDISLFNKSTNTNEHYFTALAPSFSGSYFSSVLTVLMMSIQESVRSNSVLEAGIWRACQVS